MQGDCQGILGEYCMRWLGEFLWTRTIFNPPHMWDLMDDVDDTYKQSSLMLNDAINLNEVPMDATKVMQDFNVEQGTNVDNPWMFEPIFFTHIPTLKVTRSYIELLQEISGNYTDPIEPNAIITLPISPTSTLPTCRNVLSHCQTIQPCHCQVKRRCHQVLTPQHQFQFNQ